MSTTRKVFLLRRYILDRWNKIQRFCLNFSINSINNINVTKNDLLIAIDELEYFEYSTRTFDKRKSCKYFRLQSLIILLLNSVQSLHYLLLSFTDNETIRLYAGDIFVSSSERNVLNYIGHFGLIIPCMIKIFLLYLNQLDGKSFLNIFDEYKEFLKENTEEFSLLSTNEKSFRRSYYFLIKFYYIFAAIIWTGVLSTHTSTAIFNYSSLKPFIIQLVHVTLVAVLCYFIVSTASWFMFIIALGVLFIYNSIVSLRSECVKLSSITDCTRHDAESFYYKQSLLSNWIDCFNAQSAWIFYSVYIYVAFHSILIFFYLTQFTFDNLGVKDFLIFSNILTLSMLYLCNYFGSLLAQKASLLHLSIYRLSIDTGKCFKLKVALKKLEVLERFAARKMGAYLGNYIYLDNNFMLLATLECGSLYFLFCANINRNNQ